MSALRGAAGLADRLYRQRRLRHRAAPTRRRFSSTAATPSRRASRSTRSFRRANIVSTPRRRDWLAQRRRRAPASATIRGCTRRRRSRVPKAALKKPGPNSSRSKKSHRRYMDRPPRPPLGAVTLHARNCRRVAGKSSRGSRRRSSPTPLLVSDPHAVAWAFNMRGGDVAHTPIALASRIVFRAEGRSSFSNPRSSSKSVAPALGALAELAPPETRRDRTGGIGQGATKSLFSTPPRRRRNWRGLIATPAAQLDVAADPDRADEGGEKRWRNCAAPAPRICARRGHDVEFLAWFAAEAPKGKLTEISAARRWKIFAAPRGNSRTFRSRPFPPSARTPPCPITA